MRRRVMGLLVFAGVLGGFHWFQWRPAQIRKECHKIAEKEVLEADAQYEKFQMSAFQRNLSNRGEASDLKMGISMVPPEQVDEEFFKRYEKHYKQCLHSKGLRE